MKKNKYFCYVLQTPTFQAHPKTPPAPGDPQPPIGFGCFDFGTHTSGRCVQLFNEKNEILAAIPTTNIIYIERLED